MRDKMFCPQHQDYCLHYPMIKESIEIKLRNKVADDLEDIIKYFDSLTHKDETMLYRFKAYIKKLRGEPKSLECLKQCLDGSQCPYKINPIYCSIREKEPKDLFRCKFLKSDFPKGLIPITSCKICEIVCEYRPTELKEKEDSIDDDTYTEFIYEILESSEDNERRYERLTDFINEHFKLRKEREEK